jgi:type I restriction enzyme, S subunit
MKWQAYPEYRASVVEWLGEVPAHWDVKPLSRIATTIQTGPFGSQLHENDYVEDEIPVINPAHIANGRLVPNRKSCIDAETAKRLARHCLLPGDIVMARRGEIGRCAMVTEQEAGWLCGTGTLLLRLESPDSSYFAAVFGSAGFSSRLELNAVGTTMLNLNPSIVGRMTLAYPPLAEQSQIAEFIRVSVSKIDALIAKKTELIERLNEKRKALISRTVTRGLPPDAAAAAGLDPDPPLKPTGIDWIGAVPRHWNLIRLRRCATIQTGVTLGKEYPEALSESRPYLRVANVQDGYLDLTEIKDTPVLSTEASRFELRPGDVLMTEGGDFDKLGRGCVWDGQVAGCLHQNHIFAVRPDTRKLVAEYLSLAMTSDAGKHYFTRTSQQSTNLATTNQTKIKDFVFPLPPLAEQRAILNWMAGQEERFRNVEGKMRDAIGTLEEYRSALITAAVTGKIDVRGWRAGLPSMPSGDN